MSKLQVDGLPAEVLQRITAYLHDCHSPTLWKFSLVSKNCYSAAKVWMFRKIRIKINNTVQMQGEAGTWTKILQRTQSQQHVRDVHIVIIGPGMAKIKSPDYTLASELWREERSMDRERDGPWLPVANLIGLLPCLKDLTYSLRCTMPPCLLEVLHEKHPQCLWHIQRFQFRSLHKTTVDPQELAMATSPCLYSISVATGCLNADNHSSYIQLVATMAPNLRILDCERDLCQNSAFSYAPAPNRQAPRGCGADSHHASDEPSLCALESLSFFQGSVLDPMELAMWQGLTDFSALRCLKLEAVPPVLNWAAENVCLPNLKILHLFVHARGVDSTRYTSSCVAFLSMIPPLDELQYIGEHGEVLDCILDKHGPSLQVLVLNQDEIFEEMRDGQDSRLDLPALRQIQEKCPHLKSFDMAIERHIFSKSRETEISMYKTIAKMRRLTHLNLRLHCKVSVSRRSLQGQDQNQSEMDPYEQSDDAFERIPSYNDPLIREDQLHTAILNTAVDEPFARSVWATISQSKEGRPLHAMKLIMTTDENLDEIVDHLGVRVIKSGLRASYRLERSFGDDKVMIEVRRRFGSQRRDTTEDEYLRLAI